MRKIKILYAVIPLIILVGITVIMYISTPINIEVREGYQLLQHNVTPFTVSPHINKTVYAITLINNGTGMLNLSVSLRGYNMDGKILVVFIDFSANFHMKDKIVPQKFLFHAKELENSTSCYNFQMSYFYHTNSTELPNDMIFPGAWAPHTAYIGIYPHSSDFETGGELLWDIHDYKNITVHTLRIEGVCIISSQEIPATVDVEINTHDLVDS